MNNGFNNETLNVVVHTDEVKNLLKKYKKVKKYMKSSFFAIKTMDGTETIISKLLQEVEDTPS